MVKPSEIYISAMLLMGVGVLVLIVVLNTGGIGGTGDSGGAEAASPVPVFIGSPSDEPPADSFELSVWQEPLPSFVIQIEPTNMPALFGQASDLPMPVTLPESGDSDCRYWNVLRPVDRTLESFWIGGWVEECEGVLGPVVPLSGGESIEEVYLRLENALARIDQLEQQLGAVGE